MYVYIWYMKQELTKDLYLNTLVDTGENLRINSRLN